MHADRILGSYPRPPLPRASRLAPTMPVLYAPASWCGRARGRPARARPWRASGARRRARQSSSAPTMRRTRRGGLRAGLCAFCVRVRMCGCEFERGVRVFSSFMYVCMSFHALYTSVLSPATVRGLQAISVCTRQFQRSLTPTPPLAAGTHQHPRPWPAPTALPPAGPHTGTPGARDCQAGAAHTRETRPSLVSET